MPRISCRYVELSSSPSEDGKGFGIPDVDVDSFVSVWIQMSGVRPTWGVVIGLGLPCAVKEDPSPFLGGGHLKPSCFNGEVIKYPWSEEAGLKLTSADMDCLGLFWGEGKQTWLSS